MKEDNQSKQPVEKTGIIKALEELTREPGFLYSLAFVLRHDLFLDPSNAADINWREHLSFQEISFLVGLLAKNKINLDLPNNEGTVMLQVQRMYDFFEKLHKTYNEPFINKLMAKVQQEMTSEEASKKFSDFWGSGDLMIEPIFYCGSGAYDFQYLEFSVKKYKKDTEWIRKNKGIDIETITKIATELKKLSERKFLTSFKTDTFDDLCRATLDIFCFKSDDIEQFGHESTLNFLTNFSLIPGNVNKDFSAPGAYNAVDSHPIVQLQENYFFLPSGFSLTQSIYESPFYWMSSDTSYSASAFKHRGEAAEEIAYDILVKVFGKDNVYKNIKVYKSKKEIITDIDVFAVMGNKSIIIQAKSKKLTELSRCGNEDKLRADFEEAVQKSYNQGLACRESIIDKNNILVDSDGNELHLSEYIDDAYIICLSSEHYPAIIHQVNIYLQKSPTDPYPLAMSIFDLDIIAFYLQDPFEFLYYLRQRGNLTDYYIASSEIALLSFHLNHKLLRSSDASGVAIDESLSQLIDANFPAMQGYHPKTKAVERLHHKWKNDNFQRLIEQVKNTKQPRFTDAIFFLYDLAGKGADYLIKMIEQTKEKTARDRRQHDFSMIFEKGRSGITFLSLVDSPEEIERKLMPLAVARKYKTKADQWLALGSIAGSPNIIDAIAFNKQPWKEDSELEKLTDVVLKRGIPINPEGKIIGRNDPCYCGSGKKFKKCCGK